MTINTPLVYSCYCDWAGSFFKWAPKSDLVAVVKVTQYLTYVDKDGYQLPLSMEVEIIHKLLGNDVRDKVIIWGDEGWMCRPYLDQFEIGSTWAIILYYNDGYFGGKTDDYFTTYCFEAFMPVVNDTVTGYINSPINAPQNIQKMEISHFIDEFNRMLSSVTLNTQVEVNSFTGTSITNNLCIDGNNIVDLSPLSTITSVGGDLYIYNNDALTSLAGLDNITSVGGGLYIYNNNVLTSLAGLENITSVGSDLYVYDNDVLTSLTGLANITSLGGFLRISNNDVLTSLDGLGNITSVGSDLYVYGNDALTSLTGLANITSLGGSLYVIYNDGLTSLAGLDNITSIDSDLYVIGNDTLTSLVGLDNITYLGGDLFVNFNARLNIFCGLHKLISLGGLGGNYFVFDNLINPTQQKIIDDGPCILSVVTENELKPMYNKLRQNYPNPFNPNTKITYFVSKTDHVSLSIYNELGEKVIVLVNERQSENYYTVNLNLSEFTSGIYFYILKIGDSIVETKKMQLIR